MRIFLVLLFSHFFIYSAVQERSALFIEHRTDFEIKALTMLNSKYRETNLSITPDGKYLYFMSDRGGQPWSEQFGKYNGKKSFDGDIWYAKRSDNTWSNPICLDSAINTNSGEDEPIILPDGQRVVFQSWKDDWKQTGGPYYQAELSGKQWTGLTGLYGGINIFFIGRYNRSRIGYATDGATVSPDGQTFIVACGEDYDGEMDLYMSHKVNDEWRKPKKMSISTPADERSVFLAGDGQTLYFASDGYEGFGGLDIFKTTLNEDGTFGEVLNIGEPFNTKDDDYGFIIAASGEEAFFVRDGDIYSVDISTANPRMKPKPVLIIAGTVKNAEGNFIETTLNLIDVKSKNIITASKSNSVTGEYSFSTTQQSTTYQIKDAGARLIDTTFNITISQAYKEREVNLLAKKAEPKEVIVDSSTIRLDRELKSEKTSRMALTYFEFDQATLSLKDKKKLVRLVEELKGKPNYQLKITGHADAKGSDEYNKKLALQRVEAVKSFLVREGLDAEKIDVASFGENNPISDNATEEGRRENRRVVVEVVY